MKRCMYCGNENDDSSQNCSKCGNRLLDTAPEQAVPMEDIPVEDNSVEPAAEESAAPVDNGAGEETPVMEEAPVMEEVAEADTTAPEEQPQADPYGGQPFYGQPYGDPNMQYGGQPYGDPNMQYGGQPYGNPNMQYGGQPYGDPNMQQYGGQGYAPAQQQYYEQGYNPDMQQYGRQPYGNPDMQYGGQAYGYQQPVQQYGKPNDADGVDMGRTPFSGGSEQLMMKARKRVKSFLFFLVSVCFTASLVSAVLNIVTGNMAITLQMAQTDVMDMLGNSMVGGYISAAFKALETISSYSMVIMLVLEIPALLVCLGFWMMFFATSTKKGQIATTGYTMVKVIYVLEFICICLFLALILVGCVGFVVAAGASGSVTSIIVGVVVLLVVIVIAVLVIMFYVQMLHMMKVVKCNVRNGADVGGISAFVPVIGILLAILTGLSMIPMSPDGLFGLINKGSTAAWMLFASIWVLVYRAKTAK